ncbi:MAG: DNA-binding protein [Spirochaetales bacterium]|nr:DNA-binding protein [Spirochaetales bacterium]
MESITMPAMGRTIILRLDPGEDLLEGISRAVREEKITNGVVVSGIGTLDRCVLHMVTTTGYPPEEYFRKFEDTPLEVASIDGIIANGTPHLHMAVSDTEQAWAGHLEKGCRVLYLAEIAVCELKGPDLTRKPNDRGIGQLTKA